MNTLLLFVAEPRPGRVKTRLSPPLSPFNAALLYHAMLRDSLTAFAALEDVQIRLCHGPESSPGFLEGPFAWEKFVGPNEGRRMGAAVKAAFERGAERVVVMHADQPTLPVDRIRQAFHALEDHSLALGPTDMGGIYLAGFNRSLPVFFKDIEWSGDLAFEQAERLASAQGLRYSVLSPWYRVEMPGDLDRLRSECATYGDRAPLTETTLRAIA